MGLSEKGFGTVAAALCPMHGPVVRSSVTELVRQYRWVPPKVKECFPMLLFGCSEDQPAVNSTLMLIQKLAYACAQNHWCHKHTAGWKTLHCSFFQLHGMQNSERKATALLNEIMLALVARVWC